MWPGTRAQGNVGDSDSSEPQHARGPFQAEPTTAMAQAAPMASMAIRAAPLVGAPSRIGDPRPPIRPSAAIAWAPHRMASAVAKAPASMTAAAAAAAGISS